MTLLSRIAVCAVALLLCAGGVARSDTIPNVQYSDATGHWYKIYTDSVSWKTAKANAESVGGYLAVVTSAAEDSFLGGTLGARDKWIGATDETSEGTWVWVNGETWSYTGWNSGEPNNLGDEDFLQYYSSVGAWNDDKAGYSCGYIVEWDKDPNVTDPPEAPTGLSATATTETRVDLVWTDNSEIESAFEVERSVGGDAFALLTTLGEDAISYADTSVLPGGDYSYRVRATNKIGPSAWSQTASATTSPPPVSALAASVLSNHTIELTWKDDSGNDEQIGVERGLGAAPAAWTRIALLAGDATSHADSTVSPDTTYTYRLQPLRTGGGFAPSSAVTIKSSPTDPIPGQPVVRDGTRIDIVWQDLSDGETSYEVERGIGCPGQGFQRVAVLAADKTTYRDPSALPETTYSYRVRAVGPTGPSEWTPEICVTTPPHSPGSLAVLVRSTTEASLTWTDPSGLEDGYHVDRREKDDDRWVRLADVPPDGTSFDDTTARQDVRYVWRVAAFDENGDSAWVESGEIATPSAVTVDRVTITRPKATSKRPPKLQATGSFDAGVAGFVVAETAELRLAGATVALANRRESKRGVQLDGDQVTLLLKPSKAGSSRVAFVLTATGDRVTAEVEPGDALRLWYVQPGFSASGSIVLKGDKFAAGSAGTLADPPLAVDVFAGALATGGKDRLNLRCRFATGTAPETAPDVSVQIGALQFSAPGSRFKKLGEKWVYSQKLLGSRKVVLDWRTGVATFTLSGIELGAFTGDFDPGELVIRIGALTHRDRLEYSITKRSVVY